MSHHHHQHQHRSSKRYIADHAILDKYNAKPMYFIDDDDDDTRHISGIEIAGWKIETSTSTIANEGEMDDLTFCMEDLANANNVKSTTYYTNADTNTSVNEEAVEGANVEGGGVPKGRRRLCLPEIVFAHAFISLKKEARSGANNNVYNDSHSHNSNKNDNDNQENEKIEEESLTTTTTTPPISIECTAKSALSEWASCHSFLDHDNVDNVVSYYKGVSIIKSIDAKLWEEREKKQQQQQRQNQFNLDSYSSSSTSIISSNANTNANAFNYDWTFSTPYTGSTTFHPSTSTTTSTSTSTSEIQYHQLKDKSQPILYFDDINLYEDDMHDNGYVSLRCKIRVMPTCFFLLLTLFVRVDHVLIRVREVRFFCSFGDGNNDNNDKNNNKKKKMEEIKICKDVCWRECKWDTLNEYNLPHNVKLWRIEEDEFNININNNINNNNNAPRQQSVQQRIHGMIQRLPQVDLPISIPMYSTSTFTF